MKKKLFFAFSIAAVLLAGCSKANNGPEGLHKVSWYEKHTSQMMIQLKWCGNSSSRNMLESCKNADMALRDNYNNDALKEAPLKSAKHDITPSQAFNGKAW